MSDAVEDIGVISSVIVQMRNEARADLTRRIEAMQGAEIHGDDLAGKLIVVLETEDDKTLTDLIERIRNMTGVLGVNLVFHHNESADAADHNGSWRG